MYAKVSGQLLKRNVAFHSRLAVTVKCRSLFSECRVLRGNLKEYSSTTSKKAARGMQSMAVNGVSDGAPSLDKQQFDRDYTVTALKLPKQHCNKYVKLLRG